MSGNQELSSLNKAIDILVSVCNGISRISDIERTLGYNKTTIYRVLNTYEKKKLVIKNPQSRQYFPGHYLFSLLAEPFNVHRVLIHSTQVEMEKLRDRFDETIALLIPQGANRFLLNSVHTDGQVRFFAKVGMMGPLYDGIAGRVLLSQYKDLELEGLLKNIDFHSSNPNTPKDKKALKSSIKKIRKQGFGTTYRARNDGTMAVSVPLHDYSCPVAIVTAGFAERIKEKHQLIVESLKETSEKLSLQLKQLLDT
jgi:IclR family transcriptional regulator, KDG regulon repressor